MQLLSKASFAFKERSNNHTSPEKVIDAMTIRPAEKKRTSCYFCVPKQTGAVDYTACDGCSIILVLRQWVVLEFWKPSLNGTTVWPARFVCSGAPRIIRLSPW